MEVALGVRKGAWTEEEDALLRKCVERHGQGRWHLVPSRAGLNRCRKSCRLRWLNYLKPDIKRGEFKEDEVDLIVRLHNLLGNKWSLIAGRIPGRTANDIKNYWNTRLARKNGLQKEKWKPMPQKITKVLVFKPCPRTFTRSTTWLSGKATLITCSALGRVGDNNSSSNNNLADQRASISPETEAPWWEGLLEGVDNTDLVPAYAKSAEESQVRELPAETSKTVEEGRVEDNEWDKISFDGDFWRLLDSTPQPGA